MTMFTQTSGPGAIARVPRTRRRGRHIAVSVACTAAMMNTGLAERWVSCFWKRFESGLATILVTTKSAVSIITVQVRPQHTGGGRLS